MTWIDSLLGAFVVLLVMLVFLAIGRNTELRQRLDETHSKADAATWLAGYHAKFTWAMQDMVASEHHISYREVYRRATVHLQMQGRSRLSLIIPMDLVPKELKPGARLYNQEVLNVHPLAVSANTEETEGQLVRRITETGMQMLAGNHGRFAKDIQTVTGEDIDVIQGVLDTLDTFMSKETDRLFGMVRDPEEILPSRY